MNSAIQGAIGISLLVIPSTALLGSRGGAPEIAAWLAAGAGAAAVLGRARRALQAEAIRQGALGALVLVSIGLVALTLAAAASPPRAHQMAIAGWSGLLLAMALASPLWPSVGAAPARRFLQTRVADPARVLLVAGGMTTFGLAAGSAGALALTARPACYAGLVVGAHWLLLTRRELADRSRNRHLLPRPVADLVQPGARRDWECLDPHVPVVDGATPLDALPALPRGQEKLLVTIGGLAFGLLSAASIAGSRSVADTP